MLLRELVQKKRAVVLRGRRGRSGSSALYAFLYEEVPLDIFKLIVRAL